MTFGKVRRCLQMTYSTSHMTLEVNLSTLFDTTVQATNILMNLTW